MKITLAHGSGGLATTELINDIFAEKFSNPVLDMMEDSAVVDGAAKIAVTTDSFVVNPVIFKGGDIGRLAICGTVNDLLMRCAVPKYITCGFILEEGLDISVLKTVVASMADTAKEAGVVIVAGTDAEDLKVLYFDYLTAYPLTEEQDMNVWANLLDKFEKDENMYLLVIEENGKIVSSVQMAIIESLTHNIRPFAVIENVVTHIDYRRKGYASTLLDKASEIAKEHRCYKAFLETGSNKESTLNFYRKNGFEIDKKHSCLKRL